MFECTRVLSRLRQMSQMRYVALAVCWAAVGFGASIPAWAVVPQAEVDGSKVYEQRCAACHSGNVPRAPQLNVLRQKSPEDILGALLTGPMFFLGMAMPDAERRAVAEYIAGKPLGEEQLKATATNLCPQAPGEFSVSDNDPQWNGWGASLANTRFQTAERAGLSAEQVPNLKLKWAFGYPEGTVASQPTVVGGRVFVGTNHG
ncbi:MAG TPA: c-type cytochrome, partial [Candidatus Binatia bacterium]|nr:c-type cytochrome [Candidatus Binatia bacterium]